MLATVVALTLLAAPAGPPASNDTGQATADVLPPGSPSDQALWRAARDVQSRVWTQRAAATRLQTEARGLPGRLDEAVKRGQVESGGAEAWKRELSARWDQLTIVLTEQWPVDPTRVCGYQLLLFESTLRGDDTPHKPAQLAEVRPPLERCVALASAAVARLEHTMHEFQEAVAPIDRAVAAAARPPAETASAEPGGASPGK